MRADVDLAHPGAHGAVDPGVGDPARPVQHERHGDGGGELRDEAIVEPRAALPHGVLAADRHGQGVDARLAHEVHGLGDVGAHARGVGALAADLAELGLDPGSGGVHAGGDGGGALEVLGIGQVSGVEHHRADADGERLVDERLVGRVVEVHRDVDAGSLGEPEGGGGRGRETAVEGDGVLRQLQDHARLGGLGPGDDGLGDLEGDEVEGPDRAMRGEERGHVGQRHGGVFLCVGGSLGAGGCVPVPSTGSGTLRWREPGG